MSTLSVATIKSQNTLPPAVQNSSGTEIGTFCRAWVNFNGTGTVAIRASFNVSSITDNGTGDYTVNFTTAMSDANYSATCLVGTGSVGDTPTIDSTATGSVRIKNGNWIIAGARDVSIVAVAVFR